MPDHSGDEVDVTKLYEMLKSAEQQREVGNRVLKALIIDILRSKLGYISRITVPWHRGPSWLDAWADSWYRTWTDSWSDTISPALAAHGGRLEKVLQQLVGDVTLSDEERRILEELEKEDVAKDPEEGKDK
jgi:hypothetical protein